MTTVIDIITAAIRNERVIRFWYLAAKDPAPWQRTISPYELSEDGESILGFDHDRQAMRRYSLNRIPSDDIELPDEDYVQPIDQEV